MPLRSRMKIDFVPSPHHRSRKGTPVDLIVIHSISCPPGEFGTGDISDLFMGRLDYSSHRAYRDLKGKELSAHFLIDRRGRITQFVETDRAAYHAGRSRWKERRECNNFSVGIELVGDDDHPFTAAQYRKLTLLCRDLMQAHRSVTVSRIVGHNDIAPERKTDPGPLFDWNRFRTLLKAARGR